jgi:hypothetical protein
MGVLVLAVVGWMIVLSVTVVFCAGLFFLGMVAPGRAWRAQRDVDDALAKSEAKTGDKVPDAMEGWARKPFQTSRKATDKSAEAGRKSRFKLGS